MPSAVSQGGRIRRNISAEIAYNSISKANQQIASSRLRLSGGLKINSAADDVSRFITSKKLASRTSSLQVSSRSASEARNVAQLIQDSLDNIHGLLTEIRSSATLASSGSISTLEKVALAQSSFRMVEQIDLVANSTIFSGNQLLDGNFNADWVVGFNAEFSNQTLSINLSSTNLELNVSSQSFNLNALNRGASIANSDTSRNEETQNSTDTLTNIFAGVTGLNLSSLSDVNSNDLGIYSKENIESFISGVSEAMRNVTNVAAYVGAIDNRLRTQTSSINSQITNYSAATSRIEDANVAEEQMKLSKSEFLQSSSIISLTQANASIVNYFRLLA